MIADEYLHDAHPIIKDGTLIYSSADEGIPRRRFSVGVPAVFLFKLNPLFFLCLLYSVDTKN